MRTHGRTRHIQATLRAGDSHIGKATLLGKLTGVLHGPLVRECSLLHAGQEYVRIFQTLSRMQGHHRHFAGVLVLPRQLVGIGHQSRSFQESRQRGIRRVLLEFRSHRLQLGKIVDAGSVLRVLGTLQLLQNPTLGEHFGNHFGRFRIMILREIRKPMHHVAEHAQRLRRTRGHAFNLLHMLNRAKKRSVVSIRIRGNEAFGTNAQSTLRHVENTADVHIVRGIHDGLQICERILDFPTLVEFGATDQLIWKIGVDHGLFKRT